MPKFFTIMLNCAARPVPNDKIQGVLDRASLDWLRYSPNQYLLKFDGEAINIYSAIKPVLHSEDNLLVMEVNIANRWGWASKLATDWIRKHAP